MCTILVQKKKSSKEFSAKWTFGALYSSANYNSSKWNFDDEKIWPKNHLGKLNSSKWILATWSSTKKKSVIRCCTAHSCNMNYQEDCYNYFWLSVLIKSHIFLGKSITLFRNYICFLFVINHYKWDRYFENWAWNELHNFFGGNLNF